jgi:thiol-disulfide isomerase/thioredoxin
MVADVGWLKRIPRWLLEVLLVLVVVWGASALRSGDLARGQVPAFTLQDLNGATWTAASLRGKPALIVFWAPWCGVCRAMGSNVSWVQSLSGSRARVVSVASGYGSVDEVRRYATDHALDYPVLLGGRATARVFGVRAYPTVFVLDENGTIRNSMVGYATTLGMYLRL